MTNELVSPRCLSMTFIINELDHQELTYDKCNGCKNFIRTTEPREAYMHFMCRGFCYKNPRGKFTDFMSTGPCLSCTEKLRAEGFDLEADDASIPNNKGLDLCACGCQRKSSFYFKCTTCKLHYHGSKCMSDLNELGQGTCKRCESMIDHDNLPVDNGHGDTPPCCSFFLHGFRCSCCYFFQANSYSFSEEHDQSGEKTTSGSMDGWRRRLGIITI